MTQNGVPKESIDRVRSLIAAQRQGADHFEWEGTTGEFLEKLVTDEHVRKLHACAHKRIYDALIANGSGLIRESEDQRLKLFNSEDPDRCIYGFFEEFMVGSWKTKHEVMKYFHGAASRGQQSKQVLVVWGPPSSGKSTLQRAITRAIEMHEGGVFFALRGVPSYDDPLWLVPRSLREKLSRELGIHIDLDRDISPLAKQLLETEYKKRWEDFPVKTYRYSQRSKRGIAVVPAQDPQDYDIGKLIGTINYANNKYDPTDPRLLIMGAAGVGNRGVIRFDEILKSPDEFLQNLLFMTQDKYCDLPGTFGILWVDTAMMGSTNFSEMVDFLKEKTNEGQKDRIVFVESPYNLHLTEEIGILGRLIADTTYANIPCVPHTKEALARAVLATRMVKLPELAYMKQVDLYDGRETIDEKGNRMSYEDGRRKAAEITKGSPEGHFGLSYRQEQIAFENSIGQRSYADPVRVLRALKGVIKASDQKISEDDQKMYLQIIDTDVEPWVRERIEKDIHKALVSAFDKDADRLFGRVIDHAEAFVAKDVSVGDGEDKKPVDKKLLEEIASQLKLSRGAQEGFWQDMVNQYNRRYRRSGKAVARQDLTALNEAIESYIREQNKKLLRIITATTTRNENDGKEYENVVDRFVRILGYPRDSVEFILDYSKKYIET